MFNLKGSVECLQQEREIYKCIVSTWVSFQHQTDLRRFRTRTGGAVFHNINNTLMTILTIDEFEPSECVLSSKNFVLLAKKSCNWNSLPLLFLYVSQCTIVTSKIFAYNQGC